MNNPLVIFLVSTLLPFIVAIAVLRILFQSRLSRLAVDQPNHRSLHVIPVPRTGGLAIMAAVILSWGVLGWGWLWPFAICTFALIALSFADDLSGLSAGWRFLGQFLVAGGFVWSMMPLSAVWFIGALTIALVWMTNLYNFMDGSDGLAGGMALFGFSAYALAAWLAGDVMLAAACVAVVASASAFLIYNFHPARIFMGDAGSVPLGFLAGALGIYGWQQQYWPLWFPLLVFSPFVVDATVTLLKRLFRGEKIWQAHRSHYYQRLVQMGWGHRKTALYEYALMFLTGTVGLALLPVDMVFQQVALLCVSLVFLVLMLVIDRKWQRHQAAESRS